MDYQENIQALKKNHRHRSLQEVRGAQTAEIVLNGQRLVNFCSNNYLGLATDPRISEAASLAAKEYGWGAGSAALVAGQMSPHEELRTVLRKLLGCDDVLLFSSGYHANAGVIPALAEKDGIIFSDILNHASLIDGCRLASCPTKIYRHKDIDHLEELLRKDQSGGARWIVTESVFSMDGDQAPLKDIAKLAVQYNAGLYIDEAHAMGVFGENGRGLWEEIVGAPPRGCPSGQGGHGDPPLLIRMGTFGKALGSYGAFVVSNTTLIDYLLNHARTFIYTTNLPPAVAAANSRAVEIMVTEPERRKKLWQHIKFFSERLGIEAQSPIIPWPIPGNEAVMRATQRLMEQGFYIQAIRAPTVPEGTERLRITMSAMHTSEQIEGLIEALK